MEKNIATLIDRMVTDRKLIVRSPTRLSWGDREMCDALFRTLFRRLDATIATYHHLPEYDEVIDWMYDTRGVGLLLIGDCGRGKSIITTGLIPVLLGMKEISAYAVHADELNKPYPFATSTMGMEPKTTCLDYLTRCPCPIIDELGVEPMINDYGGAVRGFQPGHQRGRTLLPSALPLDEPYQRDLLNSYGERTFDRLRHQCRVVEFRGDSLR